MRGMENVNFGEDFLVKYYPIIYRECVVLFKLHRYAALYVETFIYLSKSFVSVLCF